jgi:hypothetical protein
LNAKHSFVSVAQAARPVLLFVAFCFLALELLALSISNDSLTPRRTDGELRVSAPHLHFLTGRALQRLHDGVSLPFDFQLSVAAGLQTNVIERSLDRFVVSYDLWEEKFSVMRPRSLRRSSPRLSAIGAESWCLENLSVPLAGLPSDRDLWARLEIRSADAKQGSPLADPGISLTSLIEIFSRPARGQQEHWALESAPFRIADVK